MFYYHALIAWKSLRRNIGLSFLVVAGVALGVAVSTLFSTIHHSLAKDPIPEKSELLHYVRLDNWDPAKPYPGEVPGPPPQITYQDMVAIMRSDIPVHQTGTFRAELSLFPDAQGLRPSMEQVRLCFSDFFPMFQVPFKYGSGWSDAADEGPEPVIVISESLNDRLFGGANSVGKTLRVESRDFRIVGVLDRWRPSVRFYDLTNQAVAAPEDIFMPFGFVKPMEIRTAGNTDGWKSSPVPGFEGRLIGESTWIQMWVELPTPRHVADYQAFLDGYTMDQRRHGRFERPLDNRLTPLMDWIDEMKVVPPMTTASMVVSILFLGVCALNLMGLLLAKFLARAPQVGVRRALGARRVDIFVQHVLECEFVSLVGGLIGLALALVGVEMVNAWMKTVVSRPDIVQMDLAMAGFAIAAALIAGLVAGLYPAYRICRIQPAAHLKNQ